MATCEVCGERLPRKATSCPSCGVFTGVQPQPEKRGGGWLWPILLLLAIAGGAGGWWVWRERATTQPPLAPRPTPVIKQRRGGEAEAILALRNHLIAGGVRDECIAVLGGGVHGGKYVLTAVNRCENIRLGKFRVDAKSGAVSRAP